jgi:energy-coupling factor transporter transmembrane protein EcfT
MLTSQAFLLTNVVLTGPPLLLFVLFTILVFLVSLVLSLVVALLATLFFTLSMVLIALFVVLPTVFMTTMAANFIFIWGLGGYYILKWFNEGDTPAKVGTAVGDKLNEVTGGRLTWLMDSARDKVENVTGLKVPGKDTAEKVPLMKKEDEESDGNGLSGASLAGGL